MSSFWEKKEGRWAMDSGRVGTVAHPAGVWNAVYAGGGVSSRISIDRVTVSRGGRRSGVGAIASAAGSAGRAHAL